MPRLLHDWDAVQAYHDEGHGFVECSRRFGFGHTAWIKAIKRDALRVAPTPFSDRRRKYDWAEVQTYYDAGHGVRATAAHFGFCFASWSKAVQRGEIVPRTVGMPTAELLAGRQRNRTHVKLRLLKA